MNNKKDESKDVKSKSTSAGPCEDCNCPTCIFAKSQAPGDPYDIENCPKAKKRERK